MKLTVKEQQAIRDGAREIRRKVRRRRTTGKRLNLSAKRGEAFDVGGIYVSVKGIRRDGEQWVIRLEDVGEWAMPKPVVSPIPWQEVKKIRDDIHRGAKVLVWPAVDASSQMLACPVEKGQRIPVEGIPVIEIEAVTRKLPAGRKAEWHATFIRHEEDRPQLLRRVPSGLATSTREHVGLSEIEKARRDGAYTSSPALALNDESESVGPDWEDRGRMNRKVTHLKDRESVRAEDDLKRQRKAAKATLDAALAGLSPENQQRLLAQVISQCEAARMEKAA